MVSSQHENFSQRRRRTKELEEKINKLDPATKQRIYAMKASGMPKEAIAEKITYVAGDKNTAKRIVDALHDDPAAKVKSTSSAANKKTAAAQKASQQQAKASQQTRNTQGGSNRAANINTKTANARRK
eukprot:scaffold386_cov174-Ochromonas_danica.AAC.22